MIIPKNKLVAARWTNFSEKICIPIAFSRSIYGLAEHSYQDLKDLELIGYAHWCIRLVEEEMRFNAIKQLPYFRSMQTITKAVNECLFLIQATTTNVWRRHTSMMKHRECQCTKWKIWYFQSPLIKRQIQHQFMQDAGADLDIDYQWC
jgi:hypothetical protein